MRFEIRAGGAILILVGLGCLSGVVFALGLVAGYEMAQQNAPASAQAESVYPVPDAAAGSSLPARAAAAESMTTKSSREEEASVLKDSVSAAHPLADRPSHAPINSSPPPEPVHEAAAAPGPPPLPPPIPALPTGNRAESSIAAARAPVSRRIARATRPAPNPAAEDADDDSANAAGSDDDSVGSAPRYASASIPAVGHHRPFNIQIDAVMDRSNAEEMAARLQNLGYHAFLTPTTIAGATWWRVKVGPFRTEDEASDAEQELREQYRSTYSKR